MTRTRSLLLPLLLLAALPGCKSRRDREIERYAAQAAEERALEEERRLSAEKQERQAKIDALTRQEAATPDEATRRALAKQLEIARAAAAGDGGASPARKARARRCQPGDPLCSDD